MPILNYTTRVEVGKTVAEIQRILINHGVRRVLTEYDGKDKWPTAFSFSIETVHGDRPFKLPANVAGVEKLLQEQRKKGKITPKLATREQAARVAWRILKDWLQAQLALVDVGLASIDEVFLPYLHLTGGKTLYQFMNENHLALPAPKA